MIDRNTTCLPVNLKRASAQLPRVLTITAPSTTDAVTKAVLRYQRPTGACPKT